ncbi:MAG: histidinol-phosphate transaminase [Woeseiaceae bacterium]
MTIEDLARPEIRDLRAYESAVRTDVALRLHANESPDGSNALNRYPEIRPVELQSRLAERFGVSPDHILATRGSSEAIDLLIRTFCRAGVDNIVITPPTFVLYQVYADIQGAATINCPMLAEQDFALDIDSLIASCTTSTKLIFICSPNNPTGNVVSRSAMLKLLEARKDKSIVVVDEAYIEFSDSRSMAELVCEHDNLVVLRTLSKALALAGARCGAVIGNSALIRMLNGVLAPYALATPVIDCVMRALSDGESRVGEIISERDRTINKLTQNRLVRKVWPSQTNFLLVQFHDLAEVQERLRADSILIRDFSDTPGLEDCARITIGTADENRRLLAALS